MMTLEEHIKRYDDRAKSIRNAIVEKSESQEVVELLRELKAYREAYKKIKKLPIRFNEIQGITRCINIIEDCLEEVNADGKTEDT